MSTLQPACNGGSQTQAVTDYFTAVTGFGAKFNWYAVLAAQGILPSATPVALSALSAAVFNTFGHTVSFYCSANVGPDGQSKYMREVRSRACRRHFLPPLLAEVASGGTFAPLSPTLVPRGPTDAPPPQIWSYFMSNSPTSYFMIDTAPTQTTSCSPFVYYQPFAAAPTASPSPSVAPAAVSPPPAVSSPPATAAAAASPSPPVLLVLPACAPHCGNSAAPGGRASAAVGALVLLATTTAAALAAAVASA